MKVDQYKNSPFFIKLNKDEKAKIAIAKLGSGPEWKELQRFAVECKQDLLEAMATANSFDDVRQGSNWIFAFMAFALLPDMVKLMNEEQKKSKTKKLLDELEAKRRKYLPGMFKK